MTVELRPLGVKCNIKCKYCYQNPQREAANVRHSYDLQKMMEAIEQEGGPFAMFGGEALLVPLKDLEVLWAWGLKKYGSNSIQTNGSLINDEHIRLFRKYDVRVGISIDGPAELNDARWAGSLKRTRKITADVQDVIERMCREGMPPGLIVTLHRGNATREALPVMNAWISQFERLGIRSVILHILEVDHEDVGRDYALTTEENLEALRNFHDLDAELTDLSIKLFDDMRDLLLGQDERADCVWKACDSYTTCAVRGVEGSGQRTNCGRTNKEGIDFVKASVEGFERYWVLYHTPQEQGGCNGCRFFLVCKGQCPGTAIDGDWRKRSQYCEVWKQMFTRLERQLTEQGQMPISVSPARRDVERLVLDAWSEGRNMPLAQAIDQVGAASAETTLDPDNAASMDEAPGSTGGDSSKCSVSGNNPSLRNRLDFSVPEFTRVAWVSDAAREVWGPRLVRLQQLAAEIEMLSVVSGIRRCAVLLLTHEQVSSHRKRLVEQDLQLQPLGEPSSTNCFIVGRPQDLADFRRARHEADHREMGKLLGQPECCTEFFRNVWVGEGIDDTTWPMAVATAGNAECGMTIEVDGPAQANSLWHRLNIRAVPHRPCSFDCKETIALADRLIDVARESGYGDEMDWLLEILDWPVEWSALYGIAEIRTPILKVSTRTDATATEHVVRRLGAGYPHEGARGLRFPYNVVQPAPSMTLLDPGPCASRTADASEGGSSALELSPMECHDPS